MSKNIAVRAPLALLLLASSAHAGWYEVKNYVGTIGTASVHVSLQTFDHISHGEQAHWRVEGSYYYDAYRIPIPLQGQRQPDGRMVLCEAAPPRSSAESPAVPPISKTHPVPCPITLRITANEVNGEWADGKKSLPISMYQIGSLDDTGKAAIPLAGVVEIPMWHHTKTHMLLGVYQSSEDCPVSMLHLRVVNIATGRIDNDLPFDCQAGMIMTSIYANVTNGLKERQVTVGYQGGKMGYDEVIDIGPRAVKQK